MSLKVLDLFSGIGGFSLGLEAAGMETAAFCEVSPVCRHLLAHHWPKVPQYDDVCTLTAERLAADGIAVDLLCGGFPCQDLSYAGKGAGLAGERSGLWFQIARILRELRDAGRPVRIVVLENVSALLGRGLGVVLGDLAALGYDAEWDCIPASAVGAPHRRDRIWIVAYTRGEQHQGFGDAFRRSITSELSRAAVADAPCELWNWGGCWTEQDGRPEPANSGQDVADAKGERQSKARRLRRDEPAQWDSGGGETLGDADSARLSLSRITGRTRQTEIGIETRGAADRASWWATEPDVGRVAHGVPARVDRLHGLGNAVVPQIPEILGRAILASLQSQRTAA